MSFWVWDWFFQPHHHRATQKLPKTPASVSCVTRGRRVHLVWLPGVWFTACWSLRTWMANLIWLDGGFQLTFKLDFRSLEKSPAESRWVGMPAYAGVVGFRLTSQVLSLPWNRIWISLASNFHKQFPSPAFHSSNRYWLMLVRQPCQTTAQCSLRTP